MNTEQKLREGGSGQMNIWNKMVNMVTEPTAVLEHLQERVTAQDWLVPFLIAVLFVGISGMVNAPETLTFTKKAIQAQQERLMDRDMPQEQQQNLQGRFDEQLEKQEQRYTSPQVYYWSVGRAFAGMALSILVLAALYHFTGNTVLGKDTAFVKILAVICLAQSITVVSSAYDILYSVATGPGAAPSSLAVLLPFGAGDIYQVERYQQALFTLLSQIDLFTIWRLVLYAIGFRLMYAVSKGKAAGFVFGYWAFWLLITTAASYMFAGIQ